MIRSQADIRREIDLKEAEVLKLRQELQRIERAPQTSGPTAGERASSKKPAIH